MKRDDDEQLWELLGHAAKPHLSPFFARNVLRQIRQEPARSWLRLGILVPAFGVTAAVVAGILFLRYSSLENLVPTKPEQAVATEASRKVPEPIAQIETPATTPEPVTPIEAPVAQPEPAVKIDSQENEPGVLAQIEPQDYEVVANLDDLLVLYETSLWDENSSL